MGGKVYKRDIADEIEEYLGTDSVIVLHGARQVGKTYIMYYLRNLLSNKGKQVFYIDLEDVRYLEDLNKGVDQFIRILSEQGYEEGREVYALVDEIQYLDNPSSFIKLISDHHKNIHLIVSGSSSFDIKSKFKDSLVGRTINFEIYNLSFTEFLRFKDEKIIASKTKTVSGISRLKELYYEYIVYGGYPKVVLKNSVKLKEKIILQIIDTYVRKDIKDLAKVKDLRRFNNMLYVLASRSGQLMNLAGLSRETGISIKTLRKYLSILEATYVLKLVSPFSKSPSVEISKNPKVFFYDSGLLSMLRYRSFQKTILGEVFETNVFGELVKKYGKDDIHFWRTKSKQEIDFILGDPFIEDKEIIPIEVKVNFGRFKMKPIKSFQSKYKVKNYKVVSLEGEKVNKHYVYPWEL